MCEVKKRRERRSVRAPGWPYAKERTLSCRNRSARCLCSWGEVSGSDRLVLSMKTFCTSSVGRSSSRESGAAVWSSPTGSAECVVVVAVAVVVVTTASVAAVALLCCLDLPIGQGE